MDSRLAKFLSKHSCEKTDPFSHTSKIKPMGRYYIKRENLDDFYAIYNQVISDGGIAGITENPEGAVPLIVDVDFKCPLDGEPKRNYKLSHIKKIIQIYQEIIKEIAVNATEKNLYCCVLEKEMPVVYQGICKDGFHLHFPHCYIDKTIQKEYIRPEVINRVKERDIFKDIPLLEPLEIVFDKNIPGNTWLMYGSRKDPSSEAYKLTRRYNGELEIVQYKDMFGKEFEGNVNWNLPRYLSVRLNKPAMPLKPEVIVKKHAPVRKTEFQRNLEDILADLVEADTLVDMLSESRAEDYSQWMEIGWILFNVSQGHTKGLDIWKKFSSKSEKYDEAQCDKLWEKMDVKNYTLSSLKYFAKADSPLPFASWKDSQINSILHQGISMAHNDIAKILHIMYETQYVCVDIQQDLWYEFKGHRWQKNNKAISLRKHMSHQLTNKYAKMATFYMGKLQTEDDENQKTIYNTKVINICKLIDKLKNNTFKNSVMKEAVEYFYDPTFIEKMDENPSLLACENGVYDADAKIFRDGRPDDYCTKSTKLNYRDFEDEPDIVSDLEDIFSKIFVNKNILNFFKQTTSDLIKGGNRHKIFTIWTGQGDNGKSICAYLLELAFGDYFYTPPTTLLTGKQQQSSGATAELMPTKGARAVAISETDNSDVLNCGVMKKLTGGDPYYCRGLFKEPVKINPLFKLILHCNKMPNVSAEDKASWNRIRVLPFESRFVNTELAPQDIEEQYATKIFPKDKALKDKLPNLADVFLWWLIKNYEAYGDSDLFEPPEVKMATQTYHKTNDFYMQFMEENIRQTFVKSDRLSINVVYNLFKDWYRNGFPKSHIPSRNMVKDALDKKFGDSVKGYWHGVVIYDPEGDGDCDSDGDSDTVAMGADTPIVKSKKSGVLSSQQFEEIITRKRLVSKK